MDTLGGYGSDPSSADDFKATSCTNVKDDKKKKKKKKIETKSPHPRSNNALAHVVGGYLDIDTNDDTVEKDDDDRGDVGSGHKGSRSQSNPRNQRQRQTKRQRMCGNKESGTMPKTKNDEKTSNSPGPTLGCNSLITWETDFVRTATHRRQQQTTNTKSIALSDPHALSHSPQTMRDGLATQLRGQHEFHNPSFFAKVVDHFGIDMPLQRQCKVFPTDEENEAWAGAVADWEYHSAGLPTPTEQQLRASER